MAAVTNKTSEWLPSVAGLTTGNTEQVKPEGPGRRDLALTLIAHPRLSWVGRVTVFREQENEVCRSHPRFVEPGTTHGSSVADPGVSRRPILIRRRGKGVEIHPPPDGCNVFVNEEPLQSPVSLLPVQVAQGVVIRFSDRVAAVLHWGAGARSAPEAGLVGESSGMWEVRRWIANVGDLDVPVLIRGESGSGKELVARAIHEASGRKGQFLAVNTAALSPNMAVSELFGHQKGAFTGADRDAPGLFRSADGGTLFLDEVGDMPAEAQVALLRTLETGEVRPVGGRAPISVNVRVLAATDADLEAKIESGGFRQALLQRLGGFVIPVPALRDRREDFGRLVCHFLRAELGRIGEPGRMEPRPPGEAPWLPAHLVARMALHPWPGNVRELANALRQLLIANRGQQHLHLPVELERRLSGSSSSRSVVAASPEEPVRPAASIPEALRAPSALSELDVIEALRQNDYELGATAKTLGIARNSLLRLIDQSDRIRRPRDLSAGEIGEALRAADGDRAAAARRLEISKRGLTLRMRELDL